MTDVEKIRLLLGYAARGWITPEAAMRLIAKLGGPDVGAEELDRPF